MFASAHTLFAPSMALALVVLGFQLHRKHSQQQADLCQQVQTKHAKAISEYAKAPEVVFDHYCDQQRFATSTILSASLGPNCPTYTSDNDDDDDGCPGEQQRSHLRKSPDG